MKWNLLQSKLKTSALLSLCSGLLLTWTLFAAPITMAAPEPQTNETSESATTTPAATSTITGDSSNAALNEVHNAHKVKPLLQRGDLPNFHEVYPYLYRGGEPTAKGMEQLKEKGVSTIIDLRAKTEQEIAEAKIAKQLGFKYINMPMTSEAPTKAQVDKLLAAIDDAKKHYQKGEQNPAVFVHCAHGSDRTGCMIGIWRASRDGWDYQRAYAEMRKYYFTPKFIKLSGAVQKAAEHN